VIRAETFEKQIQEPQAQRRRLGHLEQSIEVYGEKAPGSGNPGYTVKGKQTEGDLKVAPT
jgi:hypothetical protein